MNKTSVDTSPGRNIGPSEDSALAARCENLLQHLCESMILGTKIIVCNPSGSTYCGRVTRIEKEDGSGRQFNVYFADNRCVYVRVA